jgi:hypothetical protein
MVPIFIPQWIYSTCCVDVAAYRNLLRQFFYGKVAYKKIFLYLSPSKENSTKKPLQVTAAGLSDVFLRSRLMLADPVVSG